MKSIKNIIPGFVILYIILISNVLLADAPPPPPDHDNFAGGGSQVGGVPGGGAPVGEGIFLLSILGAIYGSYRLKKVKDE